MSVLSGTHATRAMVDIGVFSAVINLLMLVSPLYLLQVYDRVLPAASMHTLLYLSLAAALALLFLCLFEIVRSIYSQRAAASLDRRFASQAFQASLAGARAYSGDIQPLRDLATARSFVASRGLANLFDLPFVVPFIILLAFIHPVLSVVTVAGAIVLVGLVVASHFANGESIAAANRQSVEASLTAQAFVRNTETIRAMGMTGNITEAWGTLFGRSLEIQDRSVLQGAVFASISKVIRIALQLAILGVGAWLVMDGKMTAGMIFASSIISGRVLQPLDQLIGGWRQTIDASKAWKRLKQSLPGSEAVDKVELPAPRGQIAVRDLVYIAPGSGVGAEPIIKRASFTIVAGESVAIIGPSRAGKSTLARLLVGAIRANAGSVQLDGADLRTWDAIQLGKSIGYLAQDVQLLPGSIAQNIERFDPTSDHAAVVAAAERAKAHELIASQTEGYQTQIGPAAALSGGERQRIGLARAFYGSPAFLVLDEPNAHLDQDGEAALKLALSEARERDTTVVVVTHRLSLASICDRVMLLRGGRIEAFGRSAEVLQKLSAPTEPPRAVSPANNDVSSFATQSQGAAKWAGTLKPDRR
ncbi:type I secretion system permease/ATPase [Mesorhizobium loti]|nr:type I secretion system permease/ATPase [Mesorhizobium loti]PLP58270.1 type I secretion system permease/ATPase [Mesorhizobium loti]